MCWTGTTLSAIYNAEEWIGEGGFSLPGSNWPILYMPMMRKHFGFKNGKRDTICWDSTVCLMQGWENYKFISFNLPTNHMKQRLPFLFFFFFVKELLVLNPALHLLHKYLLWNERTPFHRWGNWGFEWLGASTEACRQSVSDFHVRQPGCARHCRVAREVSTLLCASVSPSVHGDNSVCRVVGLNTGIQVEPPTPLFWSKEGLHGSWGDC